MSGLNGWHVGERSIHRKLGFADQVATRYTSIQGDLPPEHGQFYATCLPFLPITTLDEFGRPWGSILAGKEGEKGFVSNSHYTRLHAKAELWDGDPLAENIRQLDKDGSMLVAGIGVEFSTRRRNKFAGIISKLERTNQSLEMEFFVNQAIGNCPKYINIRDLEPRKERNPVVALHVNQLSVEDRLPDDAIQFILSTDTVFLGTSYVAKQEDAGRYPSHVGMNHRGGLTGFIRVRKDGRTVVLPDFSGNRYMSSLGNIETTPLASLTFVNFTTGDILYLTGNATNLVGPEAHSLMPFQNALTTIYTTGVIYVRDALPVRQKEDTIDQTSPYSPPVRLLAEEAEITLFKDEGVPEATLTQIKIHDANIATFTWESSKDLIIQPGQAIILDCSPFLGARQYQHMSPLNPTSVNDDHIRTWTVSSASSGPTRTFSLTIRYKPGGALTTAFFSIAQKLMQVRKDLLNDCRPLNLTVKVMGVTGRFTLPWLQPTIADRKPDLMPAASPTSSSRDLVWFAAGIGVTPFLSMLDSLQENLKDEKVNIRLLLSTREPDILLPLVFRSLMASKNLDDSSLLPSNPNIHFSVDVFHPKDVAGSVVAPSGIKMEPHEKRLDPVFIEELGSTNFVGKDIFICGPEGYTKLIVEALTKIGVESSRVRKEGFTY